MLVRKVTPAEFNKIVKKRKISEKFLSQVSEVITYKLREIENVKSSNQNLENGG